MFIGRKKELNILHEKLNSKQCELGIIYGQRRIGKTSLIIESVKEEKSLYLLARDDTYKNNLNYFSKEYWKYLDLDYDFVFKSFDDLFLSLLENVKKEKIIIIIDELPYLAKAYPGILSFLQGFIDKSKRENRNLKIILSGSNMSFMLDLLENKAKPLYQRATFKIFVQPLLFSDAVKMLDGVKNVDKAKYLAIFGMRPYYLDKINKTKTFEENIIALCFMNSSILIDAPNMTLPIGFTNNTIYIAILKAIANHKKKIKEISDSLAIEEKSISTYLSRMLETTSIERKTIFNGNKKSVYYEISDPFIGFYYRIIYPCLNDIERGLGKQLYKENMYLILDSINHGFEGVVASYFEELNSSDKMPNIFHQFQNYKVDNSKLNRSIEIDIISDSLDGSSLLAGEVKFKNENISMKTLEHLKESVSIFNDKYKNIYYYLFSKTSFSKKLLLLKDDNVKLISLEEMMSYKK